MAGTFLTRQEAMSQAPELAQDIANAKLDGWTPFILQVSGVVERTWNRIVLQGPPAALGLRALLLLPLTVTMEERKEQRTLAPGEETWFIAVPDLTRITVTRQAPP